MLYITNRPHGDAAPRGAGWAWTAYKFPCPAHSFSRPRVISVSLNPIIALKSPKVKYPRPCRRSPQVSQDGLEISPVTFRPAREGYTTTWVKPELIVLHPTSRHKTSVSRAHVLIRVDQS
ncbi:hypothetical protein VTO42DRAFT_620 [Malbranchea cinnamomea]